jgi:hypothetical protein
MVSEADTAPYEGVVLGADTCWTVSRAIGGSFRWML